MKIGLIGDYQESVTAHRAIPLALEIAGEKLSLDVPHEWIHTSELDACSLTSFSALWCVPASPYENTVGVIKTIKYARENDIPFLGTCGGYQHAALEFAQTVLGYNEADNVEVHPDAKMPLISGLTCKLYDKSASVNLKKDSKISNIYGTKSILEDYYCGYGVNRDYLSIFDGSDMVFSGADEDGDPRVLEIPSKKFFIGTAFQPERSSLKGVSHPLIVAYVLAARDV